MSEPRRSAASNRRVGAAALRLLLGAAERLGAVCGFRRHEVSAEASSTSPATLDRYMLETRSGMLVETLRLAKFSAITHGAVALTVVGLFWNAASPTYLVALLLVIGTTSIGAVVAAWRYQGLFAGTPTEAQIERGYRVAGAIALAIGSSWSTMPMVLFPPSDADHRMIVVAIAAGLISDAYVLGPILSVALLFAAPVVLGSFIALATSGDGVAASIAVLLAIYATFVLFSVRSMSLLSFQRILDRVRVSDQNQTIGLLLREFEASTSDWLWETDREGCFDHVSRRVAQVVGRPVEQLQGLPFAELLACGDGGRFGAGAVEMLGFLREGIAFQDLVVELPRAEGTRWWQLSGKPVLDRTGRLAGFRGVGSDVTASRISEARIAFLASYDSLTGLANRALFQDLASAECDRAAEGGGACALLYLDLDGFKVVNDSFGHGAGDQLLRSVAQRLQPFASEGTWIFRLGGDEFAVLHRCRGAAEATLLAGAIIAAVSAPYRIDALAAEIGVSIGIALTPTDALDPGSLLLKADLALYRAKARGKGTFHLFERDLEVSQRTRRELEADLKLALQRREFELHYQPLTALRDGRVVGFEALLRWRSPTRGFVPPAEFIPVAEATGMIVAIGRYALQTACREAARWPAETRIAVNISPIQFRTSEFLRDIAAALEASGLEPGRLEIEITESVFLDKTAITMANLHELRSRGIRIALDDFGTGYSSLSYLAKFPVDKIKIDRSFVRDIDDEGGNLAVIEAILAIAQKLSIAVTAEGVETAEQAQVLRARACNDIQGFLISPARPASEIPDLIARVPKDFHRLFPSSVRTEIQPRLVVGR
ncbi:putative bifunctional diguanylate cyclase/phosphodiesterase [Methylobacterium segetis]|uniref:putative bifunctional diguanylate cyclase/phosphodiesterase n=1 Tax=Methylobacterium segetis TaxID=2488750 RepID=UPI00104DE9B5|nr:EAL domain-containing protein [Methylobacterium segetis]